MEYLTNPHGENRCKKYNYIITWPQTTGKMTYNQVYHWFNKACDDFIVCKENHKDGGEHIHCAARFNKKISKQVLLKLVQNTFPENKNVNIQVAKCFHCCWKYCKKDGFFLEKGVMPECRRKNLKKKPKLTEDQLHSIVCDWFEEVLAKDLIQLKKRFIK